VVNCVKGSRQIQQDEELRIWRILEDLEANLRASITESRAVSVDCPLLKPDWLLSRRFYVRKEEILLKTTCSSVFATIGRRNTGM